LSQEDVRQAASVQRWVESLKRQSGIHIELDDPRIALLAGFCRYMDTTPDEIISKCFRTNKSGQTVISSKYRRLFTEKMDEFVSKQGLQGHAAVTAANTLRSFLIHNGVFVGAARPASF